MITIENNTITFTSNIAPTLICDLRSHYIHDKKIIYAIWEASKLPKANNKLAYMYYEDINHFSKSEYLYFPMPGAAGMILKPHIRYRYNIRDLNNIYE